MNNSLPYKEKWEPIKKQLQKKLRKGTTEFSSTRIASNIMVTSALDKSLDRNTLIEEAFKESIELSNSSKIDDVYMCCRRMADLNQILDYSPAGAWLGMFNEEILENYDDARYWYNRAASEGNGIGMYRVGLLYLNKKVPLPPSVSLERCFTDAVAHGVPEAQQVIDTYFTNTKPMSDTKAKPKHQEPKY